MLMAASSEAAIVYVFVAGKCFESLRVGLRSLGMGMQRETPARAS